VIKKSPTSESLLEGWLWKDKVKGYSDIRRETSLSEFNATVMIIGER